MSSWKFGSHSRALALSLCVAAAAACTATIHDPPQPEKDAAVRPAAATLKRLTRAQYTTAIQDLLGADIVVPTSLEPDTQSSGFLAVGASVGSISHRGVEQYEDAAYKIADQVTADSPDRAARIGCSPSGVTDDVCATSFLKTLAKRAYRRPVDDSEVAALVTIARTAAATLGDFHQGLGFGIATILQSPSFLFRAELGTPIPNRSRVRAFDNYEMASRLSFFLWNTTPDDALLDAAAKGELTTTDGIRTQTERLLASPRSHAALRNYFSELLNLKGLDDLVKDGMVFPEMSADLGASAREETLSAFEHLVFDDGGGDYRDLFTTPRTYVNRKLASLYQVPAPSLTDFAATTLPDSSHRQGLLGHASILALYSHPTSSSAVLRGKFIREVLLCNTIPPPPANVNTALPEASEMLPTLRDRMHQHEQVEFCASCHKVMDGVGLALENFDGLGRYRLTENDVRIDASGVLDGVTFSGPAELGRAIADHPALAACVARKLVRYAGGVLESGGQKKEIDALGGAFEAGGYRILELVRAITVSDGFREASEPE